MHYLYDHDLFKKYIEEEIELKSKVSENNDKNETANEGKQSNSRQCKFCGKEYYSKNNIWKTLLKHEESCQTIETPGFASKSCKICGISSKSDQALRYHYIKRHFRKRLNEEFGDVWKTEPYDCQFGNCLFVTMLQTYNTRAILCFPPDKQVSLLRLA